MIGIIDYNAGNIKSVERALNYLKKEYVLSKNPLELEKVDHLIFPGDGDAQYAMQQLKVTGFDSFLIDWANAKKPLLGICLGSQIIFDYSEEGDTKCLGLVPGKIKHLSNVFPSKDMKDNFGNTLKIPHMGWNNLTRCFDCDLLQNVSTEASFYFVHSYVIQADNPSVIAAYANYGANVPAIIQSENIQACQFHPEKSGEPGLTILKNFTERKISC